ncbi:DNA-binding protein c1d [Lunasporangiospora selenospora]|uniref:Exosome complex protein n=1 Tax=Lunasporangiospora selenospora TaxID=979761 RepID=A0A9P6FMA2_9FUNG|nr:DNA-binding protein c1d [Lunasporangiospora selenospora]
MSKQSLVTQELPTNYENATNILLSSLAELETMLAPLFATRSSLSEIVAKLDTEKRCQLELLIAYSINTLAFINLKANGIAPKSHPVMAELARIRTYTERLKEATQGASKPSMEVDKEAAERFIRGALAPNLSADKKAAAAAAASANKNEDENMESTGTGSAAATSQNNRSRRGRARADPFQGYSK